MKNTVSTMLALMLFIFLGFSQDQSKEETSKKINNYISELDKIGFNGSLLVELNDELLISTGYVYSNKEMNIKNSSNTIFSVGSITKQFTASAILKLEMQGKLLVEDKISKYFDNLPVDKESITIHDLLRHQSGLVSNIGRDFEAISESDFLKKVFSSDLQFETGTGFSYSNIGYSLLAIIIEKLSGQSYEAYLYENLWRPSKMEMTGYSRPEFDKDLIAVGYYGDDKVWG